MTIRLVPFTDEHAESMYRTWKDPDIQRFTTTPNPTPPGWFDTWRAQFDSDTKFGWAVVDTDEPAPSLVGYAVAFSIDREAGELELGYATAPWARRRGVASETLRLLTDWALDGGFQRLALLIVPDNLVSQHVAERCGYSFEGVLRSLHNPNGGRGDLQSWSLLPSDIGR